MRIAVGGAELRLSSRTTTADFQVGTQPEAEGDNIPAKLTLVICG
jgi:hypothetical protein